MTEIKVTKRFRKDGVTPLKHPKESTVYRPNCAQPKVQGRHLEPLEGARHERRPSSVAKRSGKKRVTEIACADEYEQPTDWSEGPKLKSEDFSFLPKGLARYSRFWSRLRGDHHIEMGPFIGILSPHFRVQHSPRTLSIYGIEHSNRRRRRRP